MNKLVKTFWIFLLPVFVSGQIIEFKSPGENEGYYDKSVRKGDTIILQEEAHVLSLKSYNAYKEFKQNYIDCLDDRDHELADIQRQMDQFDKSMDRIIQMMQETDGISDEILTQTGIELDQLLAHLNADIDRLESIQNMIDQAEKKLQKIEQQLKKERKKLFWRKVGDILIAGGVGVLAGALLFGG